MYTYIYMCVYIHDTLESKSGSLSFFLSIFLSCVQIHKPLLGVEIRVCPSCVISLLCHVFSASLRVPIRHNVCSDVGESLPLSPFFSGVYIYTTPWSRREGVSPCLYLSSLCVYTDAAPWGPCQGVHAATHASGSACRHTCSTLVYTCSTLRSMSPSPFLYVSLSQKSVSLFPLKRAALDSRQIALRLPHCAT